MTGRTSRVNERSKYFIKYMSRTPPPGCTNPPNVNNNTAFLYYSASLSILVRNTACKISEIQEPNIILVTPIKRTIITTETLELLLKNYRRNQEKIFGYQIFLTTLYQHVHWSMQDAASTYTRMDVKKNIKTKLYIVDV